MKKSRHIFAIVFVSVLIGVNVTASAQVNIWEGISCQKKVVLMPYPANSSSDAQFSTSGIRPAIIICPGGSYFWHDMETEGYEVARWLQQQGIAAFVLRYRTAYVPAFIQAIRYVKSHAGLYGVDTCKIGVMGFSAGGHLAMYAAEFFTSSDRPAFVAPIYPVVTMSAPCVHRRSRRGLLGESKKRNQTLRDSLSLEKHVPYDCPPVFLVNCKDDPVVDFQNSVLLDSALTANKVPHVYYQYQTGGHGFGASDQKGTAECRQWKNAFLEWLSTTLLALIPNE